MSAWLKWQLIELASQDENDIESNEFEILGEDLNGIEGFSTSKITEVAQQAHDRIIALEAMLAGRLELIRCGIGGNHSGDPKENELYTSVVELLKQS